MTHLTIVHYLVLMILSIIFIISVAYTLKEKSPKVMLMLIFTSFIVLSMLAGFSMMALDKYTKKVKITGLKNRRILNNETIVYQGYVTNVGDYTIGSVEYKIKIVNMGHALGRLKGSTIFTPSSFMDFIGTSDAKKSQRAQKIEKSFIIAQDLEPGKRRSFMITMPFPPYFKQVSDYKYIYAH